MITRPLYAAIDVGTNSLHIVIASVNSRGIIQIHSHDRESVRLGETSSDMKYLTPAAAERGVLALKRFTLMAENLNARIRAVGTSALREAHNRELFLDSVYNETGIRVEVISGREEARLIYLGVLQALPVYDSCALVVDIGGGSTETAIGCRGEMQKMYSHKLGAIRLSRRFFIRERFSKGDLKRCREHIRGELAPTFRALRKNGFDTVIGSSGTIETIASMIAVRKAGALPASLNGFKLTRNEVLECVDSLVAKQSYKKRAAIPGMDPKRADIILGGALILEQFIREMGIKSMMFSDYALREGILLDTIQKQRDIAKYHHLNRLRYESVRQLGEHCRVDFRHANHVRKLALRLFDELQSLHRLSEVERELLEAAAYLHDVGYHIASNQHHHHSYYIIRNASLLGFTNDETEIVANIARYHRKSHPKPKHQTFQKLPVEQRPNVKILAGILRIAEGLDRRHMQNVTGIAVTVKARKIVLTLTPKKHTLPPDIEIWGAERKQTLLEEALNRRVVFVLAS